jgi:hypothetical protein
MEREKWKTNFTEEMREHFYRALFFHKKDHRNKKNSLNRIVYKYIIPKHELENIEYYSIIPTEGEYKRVITNRNFVKYCERRNKRFNVGDLVWYMLHYGPSKERVAIVTNIRDYSSGWIYTIKYIVNSDEVSVSSDGLIGVEARNLDKENDY